MTMLQIKKNWETLQNKMMNSRGLEDPITIMFCTILEQHIKHCVDFGKTPYTKEYNDFVETLYNTCINYEMPEI